MTRLRFERLRRDLSQHEVALEVRINQSDLSKIERKVLVALPGQRQRLSTFYGLEYDTLMQDVSILVEEAGYAH